MKFPDRTFLLIVILALFSFPASGQTGGKPSDQTAPPPPPPPSVEYNPNTW